MIDAATRDFVRQRARTHCEYCGLPQAAEPFFTFHIEHIVARQHGGTDDPENHRQATGQLGQKSLRHFGLPRVIETR